MAKKNKEIRFASGSPEIPFSNIWRCHARNNEVYLFVGKTLMKLSLHSSGVWCFSATTESGLTIEGNRRFMQWQRPDPAVHGITHGPGILVPFSTTSRKAMGLTTKPVYWFDPPGPDEVVEFSLHFVQRGFEIRWEPGLVEIGRVNLSSGGYCVVIGQKRLDPNAVARAAELVHENQLGVDSPDTIISASFMWLTRTAEGLPLIIDMPVASYVP